MASRSSPPAPAPTASTANWDGTSTADITILTAANRIERYYSGSGESTNAADWFLDSPTLKWNAPISLSDKRGFQR
jgi:hypothetical protein